MPPYLARPLAGEGACATLLAYVTEFVTHYTGGHWRLSFWVF
jgi:hypothetical protein